MKRRMIQLGIGLMGTLCVAGVGMAASPPTNADSPTADIFGATLGMSLAAWKASSPPSPAADARHVCADGVSASFGRLPPRTEAETRSGVVRCTYLTSPDPLAAPQQFAIGGGFRTRRVAYDFMGGSLYRVLILAPGDAFDYVVARIRRRMGDPARIERDTIRTEGGVKLSHVRMEWRGAASRVVLDDPTRRGDEFLVTYTDAGAAARSRTVAPDRSPSSGVANSRG